MKEFKKYCQCYAVTLILMLKTIFLGRYESD